MLCPIMLHGTECLLYIHIPHPPESVIWTFLEFLLTSLSPSAKSCYYCQVRHSQDLQRHLQLFHLLVSSKQPCSASQAN